MLTRATIRRTSMALLALLVFAQGALAAARCEWQERSAARAVSQQEAMPCHETSVEARNVNLCLAHCNGDDQALDRHGVPVHAMPAGAILLLDRVARAEPLALRLDFAPPGAPPPLVLFQVIRQ